MKVKIKDNVAALYRAGLKEKQMDETDYQSAFIGLLEEYRVAEMHLAAAYSIGADGEMFLLLLPPEFCIPLDDGGLIDTLAVNAALVDILSWENYKEIQDLYIQFRRGVYSLQEWRIQVNGIVTREKYGDSAG